MDEEVDSRLSGRARRAIPLIAAAITVIVTASLIYVHPGFGAARHVLSLPSPTPSPSVIPFRFSVTYAFASLSAGWSLVAGLATTADGGLHWTYVNPPQPS